MEGRVALAKYNWRSPEPLTITISMPTDLQKFFWIENYEYKGAWSKIYKPQEIILDEEQKDVYDHIVQLGNVVMRAQSEEALKEKNKIMPEIFHGVNLFHYVSNLLTFYNFKLGVRRSIHKKFERIFYTTGFLEELDKQEFTNVNTMKI